MYLDLNLDLNLDAFDTTAYDAPADLTDGYTDGYTDVDDTAGVDPAYATVGYDPADGVEDLFAGGYDAYAADLGSVEVPEDVSGFVYDVDTAGPF